MNRAKFEIADESIKQQVIDDLVWDDLIDASRITVEVSKGSVKLGGDTSTLLAMNHAENIARLGDGVREVNNRITVRQPLESLTDAEIEQKVRNVLFWNGSLGIDIKATVRGGMVILDGHVSSYWKTERAQSLVEDLEGVTAITNRLAVVPTGIVLDKGIARRIVTGLERARLLDPDRITVKVARGVVTLSGAAPTTRAKHYARKIAATLPGVVRIVNDISVGE